MVQMNVKREHRHNNVPTLYDTLGRLDVYSLFFLSFQTYTQHDMFVCALYSTALLYNRDGRAIARKTSIE